MKSANLHRVILKNNQVDFERLAFVATTWQSPVNNVLCPLPSCTLSCISHKFYFYILTFILIP